MSRAVYLRVTAGQDLGLGNGEERQRRKAGVGRALTAPRKRVSAEPVSSMWPRIKLHCSSVNCGVECPASLNKNNDRQMQRLVLIPLMLGVVLFACISKLAALLLQRTRLRWKHSFMFAAVMTLMTILRLAFFPAPAVVGHPVISMAIGCSVVIALGGWFFRGRAHTVAGLPFNFGRAAALTAITVAFGVLPAMGLALFAGSRSTAAPGPTDLAIEVVELSPKNGSTLLAQEWIRVKFKYRFSKPAQPLRFWVKILEPGVEGNYVGDPGDGEPGEGVIERAAFLEQPGKVHVLSIVAKDETSNQIFRQDIPVDYTFVANPALAALKDEGKGSRITGIDFPGGKRAAVRKGTYVKDTLAYAINTPEGLSPSGAPVTSCSHTYSGLFERKLGKGSIDMGFAIGERCHVKQVKVGLFNRVHQAV